MDNVQAAVKAAWPASSVLGRFRRAVAEQLVATNDGRVAPGSMLAARLTHNLRSSCPALVKEACALCYPRDGRLHVRQLLPSGPLAGTGKGGRKPGMPDDEAGEGTDGEIQGVMFPGDQFMYLVPNPVDACVFLDLPGLLEWHANGGSITGPATPPGGLVRLPGPPSRAAGPGSAAAAGVSVGFGRRVSPGIDLTGLVPRYGMPGADLASPYCRTEGAADEADHARSVTIGNAAYWPLVDAAQMAFPGTAAASQLRRHLAVCLAASKDVAGDTSGDGSGAGGGAGIDGGDGGGLPRYMIPYRDLAPIVASSQAAAQHPALRTAAAFRAFLLHPASAGAFATNRVLRRPSDPASAVDCVALSGSALRRAAAAGIAAAIAAAWPGSAPLQCLKRAAARALAGWPRSPAGPYSLNAGPLGNVLKERQPLAYAQAGGGKGLMSRMDEGGDAGGYLVYVREEGKEGCLRLKLHALCRDFPAGDGGRDLGTVPAATGVLAAAPPTAASAAAPAAAGGGAAPTSDASGLSVEPPANGGDWVANVHGSGAFAAHGASRGFESSEELRRMGILVPPDAPMDDWVALQPDNSVGAAGTPPVGDPQPSPSNDPWAKVRAGLTGFTSAPLPPSPTADAAAAAAAGAAAGGDPGAGQGPMLPPPPPPVMQMPLPMPHMGLAPMAPPMHHYPEGYLPQAQPLPLVTALPDPLVQWVRTPPEFDLMLRHCYAACQLGLAVHASGGARAPEPRQRRLPRPAVAAFYAPAAAVLVDSADGGGGSDAYGLQAAQHMMELPPMVYLLECASVMGDAAAGAAGSGGGGGAALPGAAAALRDLLESAHVAKVAHGCEQVACLAALCGAASISQLHDTRLLLRALLAMLPSPPPPLPPPPPAHMAAVGPLAAVAMSGLAAHVSGLRESLGATGLWSDRPELLGALTARHAAALREDLFGVREWASNSAAHETALVAGARHLPELWAAMAGEAVPWVAVAAATAATAAALEAAPVGGPGAQSTAPAVPLQS